MITGASMRQILKIAIKESVVKDKTFSLIHKNVNETSLVHQRGKSSIPFNTSKRYSTALPSPEEVTAILRTNEFNQDFSSGSVKSYDSNQLPSNSPIEDMRAEALCTLSPGLLVGVFDGHIGPECAQVISKRLFHYMAASLLPLDTLAQHVADGANKNLIQMINDKGELVDELRVLYERSFNKYLRRLLTDNLPEVHVALQRAFTDLDHDISREVLDQFEATQVFNPKTLSVAMTGAVACVTYIEGPNLYVANVGDCNAVLGVLTEDNEWKSKKITKEHNADNFDELHRIRNEHPDHEKKTIIKGDRLLGELAPLRSIGDYRYKWPIDVLKKVSSTEWANRSGFVGKRAMPPNYFTPPYLTSLPDIFYHRLTTKDKFLILASDGLWEMMTPLQAVKLVGEHMKGKVFFNPLKLPQKNVQLGDIDELLNHRKDSLKSKPKDRNAATHLIRHALGVEHSVSAQLLSLSSDVSRYFRDDITVTVVFFDSEFLRQCPA